MNFPYGNTDIYLIDQIMKGRYQATDHILDAGAGAGRNLHWFAQQGCVIFGIDRDESAVQALMANYPSVAADHFKVAAVEAMPFPDAYFDHVICSAVLHFADHPAHFEQMFGELVRVLRPGGSLFIRAATDVGLADKMLPLGSGRFLMPDGAERFLVTRPLIEKMSGAHQLHWLEPFKTVLVDELRSMSVIVLGK